jgi:hypothetical protein
MAKGLTLQDYIDAGVSQKIAEQLVAKQTASVVRTTTYKIKMTEVQLAEVQATFPELVIEKLFKGSKKNEEASAEAEQGETA